MGILALALTIINKQSALIICSIIFNHIHGKNQVSHREFFNPKICQQITQKLQLKSKKNYGENHVKL